MWVASASTDRVGVLEGDEGVGSGLADQVDGDLDGDLLAAAHDDEVDVLEEALDRVALDGLGQGQLVGPSMLEREQGVLRLEREHQLVAGQRDVPRVGAVAVEDGGDLAGPADAAGGALAELGAGLGGDTDLGHGAGLLDAVNV